MSTMFVTTTLVHIHCPDCGGLYAISQEYKNEAYRKGDFKQMWTCPYCKVTRGYGESEETKARKLLSQQVEALTRDRNWQKERREYAEKSAEHFRKSRDGVRGALVKVKKRVKHGVCPCCNRTFQNLLNHMKSEHPGFQPETDVAT